MALAKEAGLNEKALEAALGDDSRALSLIRACRYVASVQQDSLAMLTRRLLVAQLNPPSPRHNTTSPVSEAKQRLCPCGGAHCCRFFNTDSARMAWLRPCCMPPYTLH